MTAAHFKYYGLSNTFIIHKQVKCSINRGGQIFCQLKFIGDPDVHKNSVKKRFTGKTCASLASKLLNLKVRGGENEQILGLQFFLGWISWTGIRMWRGMQQMTLWNCLKLGNTLGDKLTWFVRNKRMNSFEFETCNKHSMWRAPHGHVWQNIVLI